MATYYVGWDVGAWKCSKKRNSRDAIVWAKDDEPIVRAKDDVKKTVSGFTGNILDNNDSGDVTIRGILEKITGKSVEEDDNVFIAIDAALGWPQEFINLFTGSSADSADYMPKITDISFYNNFLFRETERRVYEQTKHKVLPKSTVGDRIGGHSTKILSLLRKDSAERKKNGTWTIGKQITILETYPTAVRALLGSAETVGNTFEYEDEASKTDSDYMDAVYCMYIAYLYSTNPSALDCPQKNICSQEGWIFLPKAVPSQAASSR